MKTIVLKALHSHLAGAVMVALILPACFSASGQENAKLKSSIEEMNSKFIVIWKKVGKELKIFRDIFNSDNPPPIARSVDNDTIWILYNYVNADKVEDFKKFNNDLWRLASKEKSPAAMSVRMLEPLRANEDGTYTFIYLMDPMVNTPGAYAFLPPFSREYGEEKAREIIKTGFTNALLRPELSKEMRNP